MKLKLNSPPEIYAAVAAEIDRILGGLQVTSADQDVAAVQSTLREFLGGVQKELWERLDRLREHGEWSTFTIAFYGETNAGKSTLIETLRILLGEQKKMARRRAFKAIQETHALLPEALEACRVEFEQSGQAIDEVAAQVATKMAELEQQGRQLVAELRRSQAVVVEVKRKLPFWKKLLFLFRNSAEEVAQDEAQRQYEVFEAQKPACVAAIDRMNHEAVDRMKRAMSEQARQDGALEQLTLYADGEIIGDGRSDFTLDTATYLFEAGGQNFALLDVPGIEGDESAVSEKICNAVHKAHAVFYITSKAATPQRGDAGKPGTLEKMRAHLADQTEVWTIFNKRVTNPVQLSKPSLVSEDEEASLDVLDAQMRQQFGENYQKHISLSAQPAFLCSADCLVPGSSDDKSRAKFLETMSPDELLSKAGLASFRALLTGDFVKDYRRKIRQANFNKAGRLISGVVDQLSAMQRDQLEPLQIKLQRDAESARDQVTLKLESLRSELDSLVHQEVDRFTSTVRQKIDARIASNLDNDVFKQAFANEIVAGQASMSEVLPIRLGGAIDKFGKEIQEVVKRLQEFANELLSLYGTINIDGLKAPISLAIKIDNGIKLGGLISIVLTVAALVSNPVGWVVATIVVLGLLVTFGKAMWGYFDDDYKKSQQRSAVSENLQKVANSMRESALNSVHENFELLKARVQEVNDALTVPAAQLDAIGKELGKSTAELSLLSNEITIRGNSA
jgi:hypothetical protein